MKKLTLLLLVTALIAGSLSTSYRPTATLAEALATAEEYFKWGSAYADKGEFDKAIADYTRAIELAPNAADVYYNRGSAYHEKGKYDRAIDDYIKAISLDPNLAMAYYNRGSG